MFGLEERPCSILPVEFSGNSHSETHARTANGDESLGCVVTNGACRMEVARFAGVALAACFPVTLFVGFFYFSRSYALLSITLLLLFMQSFVRASGSLGLLLCLTGRQFARRSARGLFIRGVCVYVRQDDQTSQTRGGSTHAWLGWSDSAPTTYSGHECPSAAAWSRPRLALPATECPPAAARAAAPSAAAGPAAAAPSSAGWMMDPSWADRSLLLPAVVGSAWLDSISF